MELIVEEDKFKQTFNCIKEITEHNGYSLSTYQYTEHSGKFIQNIPITGIKSWFSKSKYNHKILFNYSYDYNYKPSLDIRCGKIQDGYKLHITEISKDDYNDVVDLVNKLFGHIDKLVIVIYKDFKDKC